MVWPGEVPSIPAVASEGKLWDMRFQLQVGQGLAGAVHPSAAFKPQPCW